MDKIELRKIGSLRLHPDNVAIFGLPTDEPNYEEIREDIKRRGLQEPLIILADGTILSGHIRYASTCWVLAQRGLTPDQIKDEMIAVRIHVDFESKGDELEYLMDANDKRRQLDPRRIASVFERVFQVIEVSTLGKKGKKGEAVQALADRLGTSHRLAKSYCMIFGSKIVPDEVKDKVNSRDLAPSIVLEAIKFAEESAKRENRAPSMADVDAYVKHPKSKTLADTVRQLAFKPAPPPGGLPSPLPKPPVVAPPPKPPSPVVTLPPPPPPEPIETPAPPPLESEPEVASEPLNTEPEPQRLEFDAKDLAPDTGADLEDDKLPYPEPDKISNVRSLLKEALRTVVLDDSVISNLRGLHTELTSYLLAMGLIEPPKQLSLPSNPMAQVELCTSILESLDGSSDPQSVRDSLLDLVNFARIAIEKLTGTQREIQPNGLCFEAQLSTSSSDSVVEPDNEINPASYPKCGLVSTTDIEPVVKEEPTSKGDADLADIRDTTAEPTLQLAPEPKKTAAPELKPDPAPPTSQVMLVSKPAIKDEESDLVTSVIDDFLEEINRAGVVISA